MTAIHDALEQLAGRLNEVLETMVARETAHVAAINNQIAQVDKVLGNLKDGLPSDSPALPQFNQPDEPGTTENHGLLG